MLIKEDKSIQKFLQNLPGVSVTDSQSYRIEALRVYLEEKLGDEIFITAYKHYTDSSESSDSPEGESILKGKQAKYVGLIYQLIV